MKEHITLTEIVEQLEFCNYRTVDGLHDLKNNAAFISLKKLAENESRPVDGVVIKAASQAVPNGGSADEIYIKGKIDGLEEARWQVVYAIPHIDPNGRLAKQTKYIMDKCKEVQDELKTKL